jgi:TonB-linked SusC/RagA family outer membrane protein
MHLYNSLKNVMTVVTVVFATVSAVAQDAAETVVHGRVVSSANGLPMAGVLIESPSGWMETTDDSGKFVLNVKSLQDVIEISGKGIQRKTVALKGRSSVEIPVYNESFNSFYVPVNSVYGALLPETNTGSVSSVTSQMTRPDETAEALLQGKAVGLNVISRSGTNGAGANMYLRGFTSMYANSQPLIVVDGMIYDNIDYSASLFSGFTNNPLSFIDIKDIQSITLLKDAVSIYGSKAANGVLLIRTIHSKEAATKIDFYAHGGINTAPEALDMMNADQYRSYLNDVLLSAGKSQSEIDALPFMNGDVNQTDYYRNHNNTNWQKEVFRNSINRNYYLRVTGGDEIAKYGLSVGYLKNDGIIKNTDYTRYSTRFNADVNMTQRLSAFTALSFSHSQYSTKEDGLNSHTSPIFTSLLKSPVYAPYIRNTAGESTPNLEDGDSTFTNPVSLIKNFDGENRSYRFFGSGGFAYKATNWLKIRSLFGINYTSMSERMYHPNTGILADTMPTFIGRSTSQSRDAKLFSVYSDSRLEFDKTIMGDHKIFASAGFRFQKNNYENDWAKSYNLPSGVRTMNSGAENTRKAGGAIDAWKWMSFYANADYSFKRKYFLSLALSADGSSRFGDNVSDGINMFNHAFGVFSSVGASWLISSEDFMSGISQIDVLKLRASYGTSGNDDVGNKTAVQYYSSVSFLGVMGLTRSNIPNHEIQWETVKKTNLGIDLSVLNERLTIAFDYYNNYTENMLVYRPLDVVSGFNYTLTNDGEMSNKGFELNVSGRIINGDVTWDAGFGIAHYKNKIEKMAQQRVITNIGGASVLSQVGSPVGLFYGYKTNGVYADDQTASGDNLGVLNASGGKVNFGAGDVRFVDAKQDQVIDDNDRVVIGDPNPDFTGMITSRVTWKGLSLDLLFTFSKGNDVCNMVRAQTESLSSVANQAATAASRWTVQGQVTDIPKATYGDPMGNARFSDRWIEDGSYFRLKALTLSYDIPYHVSIIRNATVFASATNLLTFTKYKGYDPEFSMSPSPMAQGIDYGLTPVYSSVYFGIKLGF